MNGMGSKETLYDAECELETSTVSIKVQLQYCILPTLQHSQGHQGRVIVQTSPLYTLVQCERIGASDTVEGSGMTVKTMMMNEAHLYSSKRYAL